MTFITKLHISTARLIDHGWRYFSGAPMSGRTKVLPHVYLGGQPYKHGTKTLKKWGVTAIVSLRTSLPLKYLTENEFTVLHLPTIEHTAPTIEQLSEGVQFMHDEIKNGGTIYIHCKYGEGRGATMVIAYLIALGYSIEDAIVEIKKVRPFISPSKSQLTQLQAFKLIAKTI